MCRHKNNPAQSALFNFTHDAPARLMYGAERGAPVITTRARQALADTSPVSLGGAPSAPVALDPAPTAQAITHASSGQDDKGKPPELANVFDKRSTATRIAALGGAGYLAPDDLADFAQAEAAIYVLMSDAAWHTTEAIMHASGGQGAALRRMRNLRNCSSTSDGVVRYAHIECRRAGEKRFSLYRLTWHDQLQRHNAGQGAVRP